MKTDLPNVRVTMLLPGDLGYASELRNLGFNDDADLRLVGPLSMVVRNKSDRTIVAYSIRWFLRDNSGTVTTHDHSFMDPDGLLSSRTYIHKPPIATEIRDRESRFITPLGAVRDSDQLHELALQLQQSEWPRTIEAVSLDSIVFDDGEAFGPDQTGMVERFEAEVSARQDLMEAIERRLSVGETLGAVLSDLRASSASSLNDSPVTPAGCYERARRQYLDEVDATNRNYGEEAAMRTIANRKYKVRPVIVKRPDK